jgi:hypothetical protein
MPEPYEIHALFEEGITLSTGKPWAGHRVHYRPLGSKGRWRSFLLTSNETVSLEQLQKICATHEAGHV